MVETNLTSDISDHELGLIDYNIFHCDRSELTSSRSSGCGSLITVKNNIICYKLSPNTKKTESVFVVCKTAFSNTLLSCVYIPPNQPSLVYSDVCNAIEEVIVSSNYPQNILLMGDFNQPDIDWNNPDTANQTVSSHILMDLASTHDLRQINSVQNFRGIYLDLVLTNLHTGMFDVSLALDLLLAEERYHPALSINVSFLIASHPQSNKYFLDFQRCNLDEIFRCLQSFSLPNPGDIKNPVEFFSVLIMNLSLLIKHNTPVKRVRRTHFPK